MPGFGVSHGRRGQTGDRTEVPLLVDQHVPHVPLLGHADQRRIDHAFAVRMIVTARVAGDLRTLHAGRAGREIQIVHRHQNPPLRRLQPIAHIGQRPADDDAHRVREIAVLELIFDRQIDQPRSNRECRIKGGFARGLRENQSTLRESFRSRFFTTQKTSNGRGKYLSLARAGKAQILSILGLTNNRRKSSCQRGGLDRPFIE